MHLYRARYRCIVISAKTSSIQNAKTMNLALMSQKCDVRQQCCARQKPLTCDLDTITSTIPKLAQC